MSYYAVKVGKVPGIYRDWPTCQQQVKGFSKAIFQKFNTQKEAEAFIQPKEEEKGDFEYDVLAYADGSCDQRKEGTHDGGYGYVTIIDEVVKKYCGHIPAPCTNNIAELMAIRQCLYKLRNHDHILIRTDSIYSINSLTTWQETRKANGNKTSKGEPIKNEELINQIIEMMEGKKIKFEHVYGHNKDFYNETCDELANRGRKRVP